MEHLDLATAEGQVAAWARSRAGRLGLDAGAISARYVWNPGGFVNRSFTVSDGIRRVHIKLAGAGQAPDLRRWATVHDRLALHYRAPRLIDLVEGGILPGDAFGLVLAHCDGDALDAPRAGTVLPAVLATVGRLHGDVVLRERLGPGGAASCADALHRTIIRRFREDLQIIESGRHLLPFVPDAVIAWCREETEMLALRVAGHPAFRQPADAVVHGDLHWANILVDAGGNWTLIDWDDLAAGGDPALDFAILLWPVRRGGQGEAWLEQVRAAAGEDAAARLALYDRANLLDEVIDVLADYVEAERYPEHAERTRGRARALHLEALALYRARYGA